MHFKEIVQLNRNDAFLNISLWLTPKRKDKNLQMKNLIVAL